MIDLVKRACIALSLVAAVTSGAEEIERPTFYVLTVTNGSAMPTSPFAIYVQNGDATKAPVGSTPSPGFVQLCQTGNPATRLQELGIDSDVTFKTQTMGMLLPGESRSIEVEVNQPLRQSVHFETMYGKTKDLCAVAGISSHSLYALKQHVTSAAYGKDSVVQTGAFLDPVLPMGVSYLDPQVCSQAADAVTCLRGLSLVNPAVKKIRYFAGYLPSLTMALENKYGAQEVISLNLPTSGAIQYSLQLKH